MTTVWCYYVYALVRHERGDLDVANNALEKGFHASKVLGSALTTHEYLFIKAYFALCEGKEQSALSNLKQALTIGREKGIFGIYTPIPAAMLSAVCILALEAKIEVDYVHKLILARNFVPETPPLHIENWPWPVRIFTLGEFRILVHDKPLMFSGKVQKKPLELLKVLIAKGGRGVAAETIIDELWPDSEGDLAHKSFEMTLQRLRKLLGNDKAVLLQDEVLTLDERVCWTDVRAFERALENAETGVSSADRLDKAIRLYKGHFLPADAKQPWSTVLRERLRSKYLHLVTKAGALHEKTGQWKEAALCFEQGLDKDPVCEELYQRLMLCHHRLGFRAEAVKTYQRCCDALRHGLGLEPSRRTKEIHVSILRNK